MELKNKKHILKHILKRGITLVELIIALTMVSVLMLMMFEVIFKKTKSSIAAPSGIFYCWKDRNGKLYQRIFSSKDANEYNNSKIEEVSECKLNFQQYMSKGANIKIYMIGGGSAGTKYENIKLHKKYTKDGFCTPNSYYDCIKSNNDYLIKNAIVDKIDCFDNSIEPICIAPGFDVTNCNNSIPNVSNYNKNADNYCLVRSGNSVYKMKKDIVKNYYFNKIISKSCVSTCQVNNFFKNIVNGQISDDLPDGTPVSNSSNDYIDYSVFDSVSYDYFKSKNANFKAFSADGVFDFNSILVIKPENIGNGGNSENPNGQKTWLIPLEGAREYSAPGAMRENKKSITKKFDLAADLVGLPGSQLVKHFLICDDNLNISYNTRDILSCPYSLQNTGLSDFINLTTPEFNKENDTKGFGLFGYSGYPLSTKFNYKPFGNLYYYGFEVVKKDNYIEKSALENNNSDNRGMGGAIIIKWN